MDSTPLGNEGGGTHADDASFILPTPEQIAERDRAAQALEKERRDKADQDLQIDLQKRQTDAQTIQAKSNLAIARLTFAIVLVGAVGLIVSAMQFQAANRSAEAASKAAKAAEDAVQVGRGQLLESLQAADSSDAQSREAVAASERQSKKALDASISASRNDQRAWIGIQSLGMKPLEANKPVATDVAITNTGRTPGFVISVCSTVQVVPNEIKDIDKFAVGDQRPPCPKQSLSTAAVFPGEAGVTPAYTETSIPQEWVNAIMSTPPRMFIYLFGEIIYTDVFKRRHETEFCAEYSPKENRFTNCAQHHRAN